MKLKHLGTIGQFAISSLSIIFLVSSIFFVLPDFPNILQNSKGQEWFIVSWNLPGPLMFISVFRVHALRIIQEKLAGRKHVLGITQWVKFWFVVSVAFGILSVTSLLLYMNPTSLQPIVLLGVLVIIILWITTVTSSIALLRQNREKNLESVKTLRKRERLILGLTSIVFLLFTTLSSIALSFPIS